MFVVMIAVSYKCHKNVSCLCFVGLDIRLQAHSDPQELGKGWVTQTSKHHEKQLPHNQENTQTVDGGCQ